MLDYYIMPLKEDKKDKKPKKDKKEKGNIEAGPPMPVNEVNNCKAAYLSHSNSIKIQPGGTVLKGFLIDAAKVEACLHRADGKNVTHLYIMMAVNPEDLNKPASDQNFTTIIGGVTPSADPDGELLTDALYDLADICPAKCPKNA